MNAPIVTALSAWLPRNVLLSSTTEFTPSCHTVSTAWDAWIATWQAQDARSRQPRERASEQGPEAIKHHIKPHTARVPVERTHELSELAANVAQALCTTRAPGAASPDIVMFCHSSLDERVSSTTAGRLGAMFGTRCFPFSVSQQQGASVFTALRLAADMFAAEPRVGAILIVAAEKWHPPFSRWVTPGLAQGDAAGAIMLERASAPRRGLQLVDAFTQRVAPFSPWQLHSQADVSRQWAPALVSLIERALAHHERLHPTRDAVIGAYGSAALARLANAHLGRRDVVLPAPHAHLGAAEPIVRLAQRLSIATNPLKASHQSKRILLWGFGLGGYVATALFDAHSSPTLVLCEPPLS